MITYLYIGSTLADLDAILAKPELQFVTIRDIRETSYKVWRDFEPASEMVSRVEVDCVPNPEGQAILPTLRERLQAAETLINLILDEEGE